MQGSSSGRKRWFDVYLFWFFFALSCTVGVAGYVLFIAFPVDTTAMHPSITLQLLSLSVKSGEENQHTVLTLPIHSPPLVSSSLGSTFFSRQPLSLPLLVHLKGVSASARWNHGAKSLWARHWRSPLLIALSESLTIVLRWVWIWIWMEVASWCWECKVHKWLSLGMDSSATGIVNVSPKQALLAFWLCISYGVFALA